MQRRMDRDGKAIKVCAVSGVIHLSYAFVVAPGPLVIRRAGLFPKKYAIPNGVRHATPRMTAEADCKACCAARYTLCAR